MKVPYYINKPSLVQIGLQLFKWDHFRIFSLSHNLTSDDLWPWYITSDWMNIWRFTYYINKPSLVQIGLQLFKWDYFHIFSLSYNLTSDDLWPWHMTSDLINKWGFPCCIYDPTLVEIYQSMWKIEPNVNPFSQQTTPTTTTRQSDPCVFPAKAVDTKKGNLSFPNFGLVGKGQTNIFFLRSNCNKFHVAALVVTVDYYMYVVLIWPMTNLSMHDFTMTGYLGKPKIIWLANIWHRQMSFCNTSMNEHHWPGCQPCKVVSLFNGTWIFSFKIL